MIEKFYLETWRSVLGSSICHYSSSLRLAREFIHSFILPSHDVNVAIYINKYISSYVRHKPLHSLSLRTELFVLKGLDISGTLESSTMGYVRKGLISYQFDKINKTLTSFNEKELIISVQKYPALHDKTNKTFHQKIWESMPGRQFEAPLSVLFSLLT